MIVTSFGGLSLIHSRVVLVVSVLIFHHSSFSKYMQYNKYNHLIFRNI